MKNNNKGFTLVEMLVVIAIIGLLSSVVVVGLGGSRKKARDARRIADINSIRSALEVYYGKYEKYPTQTGTMASGGLTTFRSTVKGVPTKDPQSKDYYYESTTGGEGYRVGVCLEEPRPSEQTIGDCPGAVSCSPATKEFCASQ